MELGLGAPGTSMNTMPTDGTSESAGTLTARGGHPTHPHCSLAGRRRRRFEGRYYRLKDAPLAPGCTQSPHIPILIGGNGEKRTLRTCARYGDITNMDFWHPAGSTCYSQDECADPTLRVRP